MSDSRIFQDLRSTAAPARLLSRLPLRFQAITLVLATLMLARPVHAGDKPDFDTPSKAPVPRWAMLRKNEVYARNGPSKDNPRVWTYHAADLPVQIISETHDWRLICDPAHGTAWVSKTMLQAARTVMAPAGTRVELRGGPSASAPVRAYLRPNALAFLNKCDKAWCKVSAGGVSGWAPQSAFWGTQTQAVCARPDPFAHDTASQP